jgi:hypothetical protein
VVEPVFGQIKQARGFRQFLLRGVENVRAEWAMICTAHNLLKLFTLAKGRLSRLPCNKCPSQNLSGRAPSYRFPAVIFGSARLHGARISDLT